MTITKKHIDIVARAIREAGLSHDDQHRLAHWIADECCLADPQFSDVRFLQACGVPAKGDGPIARAVKIATMREERIRAYSGDEAASSFVRWRVALREVDRDLENGLSGFPGRDTRVCEENAMNLLVHLKLPQNAHIRPTQWEIAFSGVEERDIV
jgi:hypothetical protein